MPVAQLDDRAVILISGEDAHAFLQNILTQDMDDADQRGAAYGALLSPQGKILFDFVAHKHQRGYALDCRADVAEALAKRLGMYRLRAKVEIAAAPDLAVFTAWDGDEAGRPADPRLEALGARWIAPVGSVEANAGADDYHEHRVALTIPEGGLDFEFGDTFPHDAAMDSLDGVAFDKGCYIGQEVVSRMRHRGTARRRIVSIHANWPLPEAGAEIVAGERPLGRLGSSSEGKGIGLVRLDRLRDALEAGLPVRIGPEEVTVALPPWATYVFPPSDASES
ncbi:hypothetical protein SAMN05216548_101256 [Faunimonas pinastri]|uniref:CAF17 C-terminal domain-containing protein n=1 Tax=Faunimonas pinastri TaxID=1855383 RepID=A0A1H8ZVS8_9HYPH|nr:folate-binding protein YgfZ [Faunimonas pinastri]SEP68586.1 hypothetical protein SAMN05216548_101256 [Faunimonas pinastri]